MWAESYIVTGCLRCYFISVSRILSLAALWFVGNTLLVGCDGEASIYLSVRLRTDYQPLREFVSVDVDRGCDT